MGWPSKHLQLVFQAKWSNSGHISNYRGLFYDVLWWTYVIYLYVCEVRCNDETLKIQICPKNPGFPIKIEVPQNGWFISWKNLSFNGWFGGTMTWGPGMFRPSILFDREGSGFWGRNDDKMEGLNFGCLRAFQLSNEKRAPGCLGP